MSSDSQVDLRGAEPEAQAVENYRHSQWERKRRFLRFLLRTIAFKFLARVDRVAGLENIPADGPAILLINHIALVDPIVLVHLLPRQIVPLAKVEVNDLPVVGIFPRLWGVIPVRRDAIDRQALRKALDVLRAGEIILIAPEGTRNPALGAGREGIAFLASRSSAPVIPVAIEGTEGFPTHPFSQRWRGPGIEVTIGKPFRYKPEYRQPDRAALRQMTDDAMTKLAELLPAARRGLYADRVGQPLETIELPG